MKLNRYISLGILIGFSLWLSGCANKVTSKVLVVNSRVRIYFEGTVNLNQFQYFIALKSTSSSSGNTISVIDTSDQTSYSSIYYPLPGQTFDENNEYLLDFQTNDDPTGIQYFYSAFYSTWSDYFLISGSSSNPKLTLYESDSTTFDANTIDNLSIAPSPLTDISYKIEGNMITLTFQGENLSNPLSNLFFAIGVTSIGNTFEAGYLIDVFTESTAIIPITQASDIQEFTVDLENNNAPESARIKKVEVESF